MQAEVEDMVSNGLKSIQLYVEGHGHSQQAAFQEFLLPEFRGQQGFRVFQINVVGDVGNAVELKRIVEVVGENQNTK